MRFLSIVSCILLLAAVSMAQSPASQPSSSTAQATQQPAPPQPGQAPVSPLDEPKKATEAEPNKAQAQATATFDASHAADTGDTELGEVRLMTRHTEINGDASRSFRVAGENNLAEFNYFIDRRFLGTRRIQALSMYRGTDDQSLDPEHNSLQKGYVRIFGQRDEYIFGDTLVSFSRLSFNQNVKGVYTSWKIGDNWKLSSFGGAFVDRYGSFFKDLCTDTVLHSCIPGRPYVAVVGGGRLERKLFRDSSIGLNLSSSDDRGDTLPGGEDPAQVGVAPQPASNRLASIDTKLQLMGIRMEGEFAYSLTDFDTRSFLNCPAPCDSRQPQPGLSDQGDWGARWDANWRYHKFSLRGSFARYQPNFASMNARQLADLQDASLRASYELTNFLTVDGTFRRSNNDLKGQLRHPRCVPSVPCTPGFETRLLGPEAKLTFHDLPFYRRGLFEVGYRERLVDSSDGSIERFVRMPFAEFTLPYRTTFFSIGYERREAVDKAFGQIDRTQTSHTDHPYAAFRGIYDLGGWHLNPSLRFELEHQNNEPGQGTCRPLIFGSTVLDCPSNRIALASFFVEAPKWFILEAAFRDASSTVTQRDSKGNLAPAGYSRPSYRAALTYKLRNDENTAFIFSFERNNNYYFAPQKPFDERVIGVSFVYKFGKRAQTQ